MNFLIDECLSDELTEMALARGHWGSTSVKRRGRLGTKDWDLMPLLIEGDFILVTRNAVDFRGPASVPGTGGLLARQALHAGLVCLNAPPDGMDLEMQKELFGVALDRVEVLGDLTNSGTEVTLQASEAEEIVFRLYDLPAS